MNDRLYRSVDDRVIAGVCGGVAVRFALDPSLVRVLWVVVALVTGVFPLLDPVRDHGRRRARGAGRLRRASGPPRPRRTRPRSTVEATTAGAAGLRRPGTSASPASRPGRRERREHDPLPAAIGGLILVALGVYFLVRDRIAIDWGVVGAAGLVALGAVVILAALRPRR